jgi:hypothetical protein
MLRVSTVLFTGSFTQSSWSLQRSYLPIQPFFGPHAVWCVSYQSLSRYFTHWSWVRFVPFIWSGNRAHGRCDRSTGDAYSSMAPDPTSGIPRGPCTPILWFGFLIGLVRLITVRYFRHLTKILYVINAGRSLFIACNTYRVLVFVVKFPYWSQILHIPLPVNKWKSKSLQEFCHLDPHKALPYVHSGPLGSLRPLAFWTPPPPWWKQAGSSSDIKFAIGQVLCHNTDSV